MRAAARTELCGTTTQPREPAPLIDLRDHSTDGGGSVESQPAAHRPAPGVCSKENLYTCLRCSRKKGASGGPGSLSRLHLVRVRVRVGVRLIGLREHAGWGEGWGKGWG